MNQEGRVSVVVKSRRVPVKTVELSRPIYLLSGVAIGSQTQRAVVYDNSLDESYLKAIKEGKRLSCNLDLDFEVVDRSKLSPFRRLALRLSGNAEPEPSLILSPSSPGSS